MRIGFGYDSHRFGGENPLVLGGVVFEGEKGLIAHSDGDVVIHALIDALLGAAALGDIGSHFPDTKIEWKNADSAQMLSAVVSEIVQAGYSVGNVDITIICERPKIAPRSDEIRRRLAAILQIDPSCVSIKGKTNEKLDDIGAGLGIETHAVCLLESKKI